MAGKALKIETRIIDYSKYRFVVGIDTGVHTGFAIWDRIDKRLLLVGSYPIHIAMDVLRNCDRATHFVRVEDPRQRTYIPKQKSEKAERGRAQGAGSVKRDAKIWLDFLTGLKIDHEMVPPRKNRTKVKAQFFGQLTGYMGSTNDHARDAGMLCFGF